MPGDSEAPTCSARRSPPPPISPRRATEGARLFRHRSITTTLGRTLTMPGPFAKMSETPIGPTARAPRLGEHNDEIYGGLLG